MSKSNKSPSQLPPNSTARLNALQAACFIVGCLASEDLIRIDLDDPETFNDFRWAVKVVAECLRDYPAPGDTFVAHQVIDKITRTDSDGL